MATSYYRRKHDELLKERNELAARLRGLNELRAEWCAFLDATNQEIRFTRWLLERNGLDPDKYLPETPRPEQEERKDG